MKLFAICLKYMVLFSLSFLLGELTLASSPPPSEPKTSTWQSELQLGGLWGGGLVRFVERAPLGSALSLARLPEQNCPQDKLCFGHRYGFSYYRAKNSEQSADFWFLGYGLLFPLGSSPTELEFGYDLVFSSLKENLGGSEDAIIFHDVFVSPHLGLRFRLYQGNSWDLSLTNTVYMLSHQLNETFLRTGLQFSLGF